MKAARAAIAAAALLGLCALASCVNVTTARRSETVSTTPDGGAARHSEVRVRTYGWDALDTALDILTFPFKLAGHAVKAVL